MAVSINHTSTRQVRNGFRRSRGRSRRLAQLVGTATSVAAIWHWAPSLRCNVEPTTFLSSAFPNHTKITVGPFDVDALVQDQLHWAFSASEKGLAPLATASRLGGQGTVQYSIDYNSSRSRLHLPDGVQSLRLTATGDTAEAAESTWAINMTGRNGRHLAATEHGGQVVYSTSFGFEVPVGPHGRVRYALDAKRKPIPDAEDLEGLGLAPDEIRQSGGFAVDSSLGALKVSASQHDNSDINYDLMYEKQALNRKGSPTLTLRSSTVGDEVEYGASIDVVGPAGVHGGVDLEVQNNTPAVYGHGRVQYHETIYPGVVVEAQTGLKVAPVALGDSELHPVEVGVTANLASLSSQQLGSGSLIGTRLKYQAGASKPSSMRGFLALRSPAPKNKKPMQTSFFQQLFSRPAAAEKAKNKAFSGQLDADVEVDSNGKLAGAVQATGSAAGATMRYELDTAEELQFAEVSYPLTQPKATVFARAKQTNGLKSQPRLQVGFQYQIGAEEDQLKLAGEDVLYDSGGEILYPGGGPPVGDPHAEARKHKQKLKAQVQADEVARFGSDWVKAF
eukprot:TRINITY_DN102831_c0_g1_i1.p1 TRINITY_DN102831_c0_g1~~TRINITY_DN102831_c0_g1_i1.p1  ORF type:complete len:562 (-),score=129.69 TRINITY_DN102831_c0_g1_i1:144-1829(-)